MVRSADSIIPSLLIIEDRWRQLTVGGDLEPECPSQRGASWASPAHPGASGFRPGSSPVSRGLSVHRPEIPPGQATKGSRQQHGGLWAPQDSPGGPRTLTSSARPVLGGHTAKRWQNYRWNTGLLDLNTTYSDQRDVSPVRVCGRQGRGGGGKEVGLSAGNQEQVTSRDPGGANKAYGQVGAGRGAAEASGQLLGRAGEVYQGDRSPRRDANSHLSMPFTPFPGITTLS